MVEEKLDKLHQVLEKERTALRDVLAAGGELSLNRMQCSDRGVGERLWRELCSTLSTVG